MRIFWFSMFVFAFILLSSQPMHAQEICPGNMMPTIASLEECVTHALSIGHIDNEGIANSLLSTLDAAQAAQNRDQPSVAIALLGSFINEVEAQAGKHIDATHAEHMVMHAEAVIVALGG